MPKAVKLADIAQRLSVSTVTVSKALSGQKGVSEEMRGKIKQLAEEMGYVKIEAHKTKERKSYTLGVIVSERYLSKDNSFYWNLYQEVTQSAISQNCFTILEVISCQEELEAANLPKMISEKKIEAMIIMGTFKREYVGFIWQNISLPIVLLDTLANGREFDAVVSNNLMGAYRMTNYLFDIGHSKIGFVGTRLATDSIDDRFLGYMKSAMQHGMEIQKEWLIDDRFRDTGESDYNVHYQLPKQHMPTAFFCNNDIAANIMIRRLEESGYSVPGDISVVGFDNFLNDPFPKIGITTYAIDTREMAKKCVSILLHKLENPGCYTGVYMIDGRFIERQSSRWIGPPVPFI